MNAPRHVVDPGLEAVVETENNRPDVQNTSNIFSEDGDYKINETKRILIFMGAIYGNFVGSMTYILSVIGNKVKSYGLSQSDITTISSVAKIIAFACFFWGIVFDFSGPVLLIVWSTTCIVIGTLCMGLTFDGYIDAHTWLFVCYFTLITMAAGTIDVGCMLAANLSLPLNRGDVICCGKIMAALGSSFMAIYYASLFQGDYASFMYFTSAVSLVTGLFACLTVKSPPYLIPGYKKKKLSATEIERREHTQAVYDSKPAPKGNFIVAHVIILISLVYLTIISLLLSLLELSSEVKYLFAAIATVLFMAFFLCLLPPAFYNRIGDMLPKIKSEKETIIDTPGSVIVVKGVKQRVPIFSPSYHTNFWKDLLTLRLWCMFWVTLSTVGVGFCISFNSPQLYEALGKFSDVGNARNAALIGIGSSAGRYFVGTMESWFMRRRGFTKYYIGALYGVSPLVLTISFILFLTLKGEASTLSWIVYSFGFGMGWAFTPIMTALMYTYTAGKVYLFNFFAVSCALAAINKGAFGTLYDKAMEGRDSAEGCFMCVRDTLILCLFVSFSGFFAAIYVFYDYRKLVRDQLFLTDEQYDEIMSGAKHSDISSVNTETIEEKGSNNSKK